MNTVIALKGPPETGKTATLKMVYEHLRAKYPSAVIRHELTNHDVRAIMQIKQHTLGIETQGDPGGRIFTSISMFERETCDIIICATRTKGKTVEAIEALAPRYKITWIEKTREPDAAKHARVNKGLASDIMKRIEVLLST